MNYKDKWELLLNEKRFRTKTKPIDSDGRNPFENDYGRLISSAPIRRLQDKTQVFPLEQSDFIRTRLTHSMEVSYIAGSIGQSIEKFLLSNSHIVDEHRGFLSSLLRVSGLVHDIGNPPFGHFGEEAMKNFFEEYFKYYNGNDLNIREKEDFKNFDGNVQAFRVLSKLYYFGDGNGYNLTFSSLASIIKYPSNSIDGNKGKDSNQIRHKKFGYFITEEEKYKEINEYLDLNERRSPIVYLLEAADDIAYSAADIEDGVKIGIIDLIEVEKIFENNLDENKNEVLQELNKLQKDKEKYHLDESIIIQKFRIFTQKIMIEKVIESFKDHYNEIMSGTLENEIIDISNASDIRKAYKELQNIVFKEKNIVKKEIAGWEAICGLLDIFVKASESDKFCIEGNNMEARLFKIISSSYRTVFSHVNEYNNERYNRLQLIVDFISGMTDRYAINLFQELKGIKL